MADSSTCRVAPSIRTPHRTKQGSNSQLSSLRHDAAGTWMQSDTAHACNGRLPRHCPTPVSMSLERWEPHTNITHCHCCVVAHTAPTGPDCHDTCERKPSAASRLNHTGGGQCSPVGRGRHFCCRRDLALPAQAPLTRRPASRAARFPFSFDRPLTSRMPVVLDLRV